MISEKPISKRIAARYAGVVQCFQNEKNKGKILDIPCGKGEISNKLINDGFEVISSDISCQVNNLKSINFLIADLNKMLPFKDGSFQNIACVEGIAHLENPFHTARELRRVISTNGLLVITTPNIQNIGSRIRFLMTGGFNYFKRPYHRRARPSGYVHINPIAFYEIMFILSDAGFKIEKVFTDRSRSGSVLCFFLWPLISLLTWYFICEREKDDIQRKENFRLLKFMHSRALMFGSTMMIAARAV